MTTNHDEFGRSDLRSDQDDQPATTAGPCDDETVIVPPPTQAAPEHAWSLDDDDAELRPSWRRAAAVAAAVVMVSTAAAAATLLLGRPHGATPRDNQAKPFPTIATTTPAAVSAIIPPTPTPPPIPRLDGTYRIYNDWDHLTYRTKQTHAGGAITWTRGDGQAQTVVWAFATTCSAQNDCVATGVELDDTDHQKVGTVDALKLVNGIWQDMTPAHIQIDCTLNGKVAAKVWSTLGWSFEPLPDGTLHGEFTESTDSDNDCGSKGDTLVVPITATRLGPAPAGVLTGASPAAPAAPPTATIPPTAAPAPAPAPVPPTADPDQRYLAALNAGGVAIIDVGVVIQGAHEICAALGSGQSKAAIEADLMAANKTLTEVNAATIVNSAVAVYCPRYGG
jgi:hypothetical protein